MMINREKSKNSIILKVTKKKNNLKDINKNMIDCWELIKKLKEEKKKKNDNKIK